MFFLRFWFLQEISISIIIFLEFSIKPKIVVRIWIWMHWQNWMRNNGKQKIKIATVDQFLSHWMWCKKLSNIYASHQYIFIFSENDFFYNFVFSFSNSKKSWACDLHLWLMFFASFSYSSSSLDAHNQWKSKFISMRKRRRCVWLNVRKSNTAERERQKAFAINTRT